MFLSLKKNRSSSQVEILKVSLAQWSFLPEQSPVNGAKAVLKILTLKSLEDEVGLTEGINRVLKKLHFIIRIGKKLPPFEKSYRKKTKIEFSFVIRGNYVMVQRQIFK